MALKDLTTPTMVSLSAAWIDPARERPVLESLPQTAALLPSIDDVHRELLAAQPSAAAHPLAAELAMVQQELAALDATHDRLARGTWHGLTAASDLSDDTATVNRYTALRDKIFPVGLRVIQWSYADEAAEVALLENRLSEGDGALLHSVTFPGGTLRYAHEARIAAGQKLGILDGKRAELEARLGGGGGARQADVVRTRNAWIRAARALFSVLELAELSGASQERLLGPLQDAEEQAARRSAGG